MIYSRKSVTIRRVIFATAQSKIINQTRIPSHPLGISSLFKSDGGKWIEPINSGIRLQPVGVALMGWTTGSFLSFLAFFPRRLNA